MIDRTMNRRRVLQLSIGGVAAATLALPGPARGMPARRPARQEPPADLAYQGDLEFWDWEYAPRQAAADEVIAQWKQKYPDITIEYTVQSFEDAGTKLLTAATAGQGPPFANVNFAWRVDLQRSGVLVPYPDDLFNFEELISTPFTRDPNSGRVYTSLFAQYTDQVFYNLPLLEEQGIGPDQIPRRWDDYMKMCEQLTKRDGDRIVQSGWTFNHYYSREWLWATLIYQQGGFLYSEDGTQALWNSDQAVQALQFIQDVYYVHKVDAPDSLTLFDAFGTKRAATYISQGYTATWDTDYPDIAGQWGTAVTPTFGGGPDPAWGLTTPEEGFCVFTNASEEVQQVAFAFIRDLLGTDEQRVRWALIMNGPPDKAALFTNPELLANEKGRSITTQAETLPYRINYGERPLEAEQIWRTMFDDVVLAQGDVRAAADTATEQMNAALASSGKQRLFTERAYTPPTA